MMTGIDSISKTLAYCMQNVSWKLVFFIIFFYLFFFFNEDWDEKTRKRDAERKEIEWNMGIEEENENNKIALGST